jgi:hypothetical protein
MHKGTNRPAELLFSRDLLSREPDGAIVMFLKYPIAAALVASLGGLASAQYATEYYIVQDTTTKKCTIVEQKPTSSTVVEVGPSPFKLRSDAEGAIKSVKVCADD